jgi:hypothetical protein
VKLSDGLLMLFHDRELDADAARRVRVGRLVEPSVNRRLDALAALGDAVRDWALRAGVDAGAERRRSERARARRRALAAGASVVFSAAALPWLASRSTRAPDVAAERGASAAFVETLPVREPEAVAVETVDFGSRAGSIFSVQGGAEGETTVVWLRDDVDGAVAGLQ